MLSILRLGNTSAVHQLSETSTSLTSGNAEAWRAMSAAILCQPPRPVPVPGNL